MRRSSLLFAALLLLIMAGMAAKSLLTAPPTLRTHSAAGQFDAVRAKARFAFVLGDQRPHPTDTAADDAVRERIISQLRSMGAQPIVRDEFACNELYKQRGVSCARVRNIVAIVGPRSGKALLLNAHYDSTPAGPGASDDGIGVATLLEVAFLLKDRPLERPVLLLFNEGEELGLVGARAFLGDPLSRNVDSLINLEARGVEGPVNMFETSRPNAAAVMAFAQAVDRPVANSLATDVYRLMPNYTDVNSFAERGWLTLNLAPVGNETRYHSPGDDVAALSTATLQHMGDQTLALTGQLSAGVPRAGAGNRIFMDVAGRALITLPLTVGVILLIGLLIAVGILALRGGGLARGIAVCVSTIVGSGLLSWSALALIGALRDGMFWRAHPVWATSATYASSALVGTLLITSVGRLVSSHQLRPAIWLVFLAIGSLIGLFAPGAIIYFLFPPFIVAVGILARRWWKPAPAVAAALAILFLYLTWGAMLGLLEELLKAGPMWIFAPLGTLLILPVLVEAKALIHQGGTRIAVAISAGLTLLVWGAVAAVPAYSADRQQRFVIEHVTDANRGRSYWSVLNGAAPLPGPLKKLAQWRWGKLSYATAERWLAPAPGTKGKPPTIDDIKVLRNGNERRISFRLRTNGSERVTIIAPDDSRIGAAGEAASMRAIDASASDGPYSLSCSGRSCDGATLGLVTTSSKPLVLTLVGTRSGLPQNAAPLVRARPRFARPQYAPNQSVVFKRTNL